MPPPLPLPPCAPHHPHPTQSSHVHQHARSPRSPQVRLSARLQSHDQPQHQLQTPQSHPHANGSTPTRARQPRTPAVNNPSRPPTANGTYQPQESARGRILTYEDLSRCFHLPINSAAKELGVCVTALKKQCRKHHIKRWPHRKLKSLDKLKEKLEKEEANAADKEYYKHEIHSIVQKKDHIFRSGSNAPRESGTQPENSNDVARTPPLSDQRIVNPRASQPFASHEQHKPVHTHPAPLVISTPVPIAGRTVTLQASPPPPPQGPMAPPTLTPVTIQGSPISMCGVLGCDCYINGGVSSQNYHIPLSSRPPLPSNNGALVPAVPVAVSGPMHTNTPFYGPAPTPYPYATALPYPPPQPAPFQNMVQVNVLEQQPYGHQQGSVPNPSQTAPSASRNVPPNGSSIATGSSNIIQAGQVAVSESSTPTNTPNPSAYEMYQPASSGTISQPQGGILYSSYPPHAPIPVEGVVQGPQSNGAPAQLVPHYWTEPPHPSNRNNLVTMYNQTTHYHHHHPAHAKLMPGGHVEGTASSATNNSDAVDSRRHSIHMSGNGTSSAPTGAGLSQDLVQRPVEKTARRWVPIPSENRPPKFGQGDSGEPTTRKEGGKDAPSKDRGESTRNPTRVGPREKPAAPNEFSSGSRVEPADVRQDSEMRNENAVMMNKSTAVPSETRSRIGRMERRQQQRAEAGPPRIVGNVPPSNHGTTGIANANVDEERMKVRVAEADRMEGIRNDNGEGLNSVRLPHVSRRSPNKRPRNGMMESGTKAKSWEGSYFTAGNTGVPAVRHAAGGVGGLREITPPSDREETPFDPQDNLGSGTGSGTGSGSGSGNENDNADGSGEGDGGSGSGDGTGSGSGDGLGSRDGTGSGDGSGSGDGNGSGESDGSKEDRCGGMDLPSRMRNGMKRRGNIHGIEWRMNGREDGGKVGVSNGVVSGGGNSAVVRARRYEHVVHHCVSLLCAQWCTDKNLRVTISLGSKVLLGLAGISGHGRMIFEGSEGMLESKHCMQKRYTSVLKGQRIEWIATDGRKRYLIVLSPFRKRSGAEISGVSGLLMELTQMSINS